MATKAEIKAELDALSIKYKARASLDDLEKLLADAVVDAPEETPVVEAVVEDAPVVTENPDVIPPLPAEPDTTNIEEDEIVEIFLGEKFVDGEYKCRTCYVARSGTEAPEQVFSAQSYRDVLTSLVGWLKEEDRRWR